MGKIVMPKNSALLNEIEDDILNERTDDKAIRVFDMGMAMAENKHDSKSKVYAISLDNSEAEDEINFEDIY